MIEHYCVYKIKMSRGYILFDTLMCSLPMASCTEDLLHLLQLWKQYWCLITTQTSYLKMDFVLYISAKLGNVPLHHLAITWSAFITLKMPRALPTHPYQLSKPFISLTFPLYSCLFYDTRHLDSCKMSSFQAIFIHLIVIKILPSPIVTWEYISFQHWTLVPFMNAPVCLLIHLLRGNLVT